jgi:anti-sigma regulatory factor (Ser/Thr protein kinase)
MSETTTFPDLVIHRNGRRMELEMTSHTGMLRPVRLALEEFGRDAGLTVPQCDEIGLVLNEALANVVRHGYGGAQDKPIHVTFEKHHHGGTAGGVGGAEVEIKIRDWAKPFDPEKLPKDPPPVDPDTIKPGGLGLLCMRKMMDRVEWTRLPDGMMLTMAKKVAILPPEPKDSSTNRTEPS